MNILTATDWRPEVAEVWCLAVSATLQTPHAATVLWHSQQPACGCMAKQIPQAGAVVSLFALDRYAPRSGVAMFLEEDMIPVLPWSVDDYPGSLLYAEGSPGMPWPALTLRRQGGPPGMTLVPQRFVRDGGCPDWLPAELCEPALRANSKVLGRHFLHLDKMYRPNVPEAAAKNELLELLRQRFSDSPPARPGLGDMVSAGLSAIGITPERVSKALGVKDCGCRQRAEALNRIGRKLGIG
jgi:hypothetical protein